MWYNKFQNICPHLPIWQLIRVPKPIPIYNIICCWIYYIFLHKPSKFLSLRFIRHGCNFSKWILWIFKKCFPEISISIVRVCPLAKVWYVNSAHYIICQWYTRTLKFCLRWQGLQNYFSLCGFRCITVSLQKIVWSLYNKVILVFYYRIFLCENGNKLEETHLVILLDLLKILIKWNISL